MISTSKRVRPLSNYKVPAYPTGEEIDRSDLSRIPVRWRGLRTVASSLGAAAMSLKALALEAQEAPKPVPAAPVVAVPDAEAPKTVTKAPVTEVCPLPPVSLAGDGKGAFGCVAMNPPVILPEGEALDIIEREFAKRGVRLVDCPVVEGGLVPKKGWQDKLPMKVLDDLWVKGGPLPSAPMERRRLMLDLGTEDGTLAVEYVSEDDREGWLYDPYKGSTVSVVKTRAVAQEMGKGLAARTEGGPLRIGIFYDPCASVPEDWKPILPDGMTKDDPGAWEVIDKQRDEKGAEIAREKLIAQIEHFFKYLEKHPVK